MIRNTRLSSWRTGVHKAGAKSWPSRMVSTYSWRNQEYCASNTGILRHKDPVLCPLASLAFYLRWRFDIDHEPTPDFHLKSSWHRSRLIPGRSEHEWTFLLIRIRLFCFSWFLVFDNLVERLFSGAGTLSVRCYEARRPSSQEIFICICLYPFDLSCKASQPHFPLHTVDATVAWISSYEPYESNKCLLLHESGVLLYPLNPRSHLLLIRYTVPFFSITICCIKLLPLFLFDIHSALSKSCEVSGYVKPVSSATRDFGVLIV